MLHAVIGLTREETRAARVLRLSKVTEQHAQEQLHNSPWSRLTRNGILASGDMGDRVMQTAGRCGGGCASRRAVEAGGLGGRADRSLRVLSHGVARGR